jgi:hypothetical protein
MEHLQCQAVSQQLTYWLLLAAALVVINMVVAEALVD